MAEDARGSSGEQGGGPLPAVVSPDGRYYWDGRGWLPTGAIPSHVPAPRPTAYPGPGPGSPASGYGYPAQPMAGGYGYPSQQPMSVAPKSPGLALLVSFFLPGVGSMINGNVGIGAAILASYIVSFLLIFVLIGIVLVPVVWVLGLVHAYQSAKNWNLRHGIIS